MDSEKEIIDKKLYSAKEIAQIFGLTEGWLKQLRHQKKGPVYSIVGGRSVRYTKADIRKWLGITSTRVKPDV